MELKHSFYRGVWTGTSPATVSLAKVWKQTLQKQETKDQLTAFSCPETGNSWCWGQGEVGNLCGDAPHWEPGNKAAKYCEVQASLSFHVLWKDLWIPSFEILMFPFMKRYVVFSCYSLVQIPLIYTVGEALEKQKLHISTILSTHRAAGT